MGLGRAVETGLFQAWALWPGLSHHFSHVILKLFKILLPAVQNQSLAWELGRMSAYSSFSSANIMTLEKIPLTSVHLFSHL